jgi:hypothetical protein
MNSAEKVFNIKELKLIIMSFYLDKEINIKKNINCVSFIKNKINDIITSFVLKLMIRVHRIH